LQIQLSKYTLSLNNNFFRRTSHGSAEVTGKNVVEKERHKFQEREEIGTAEVKESGNGDKLVTQEKTEGRVEIEVPKEENKAKLEERPVENERNMQREINEIKGAEDKDKNSNIEKDGLMKEGEKQSGKRIIVKVEIANEVVEKDLLEMGKNEREVKSANNNEFPENGPTAKTNIEQKETCGNVALEGEFSKIVKGEDSDRMTEIANSSELVEENRVNVAGEEANTNVYNDGELVFKRDTYSLLSLFSI